VPEAPAPAEKVQLAAAPAQPAGDLTALRKIGVLRILVRQTLADDALPAASVAARDRRNLETWAAGLGLQVRWVLASTERSSCPPCATAAPTS